MPLEQLAERRPAFPIPGTKLHFVHVGFNKAATHKAGRSNRLSVYVFVLVQGFVEVDLAHEAILKSICDAVKFVIVVNRFEYLLAVLVLGDF